MSNQTGARAQIHKSVSVIFDVGALIEPEMESQENESSAS